VLLDQGYHIPHGTPIDEYRATVECKELRQKPAPVPRPHLKSPETERQLWHRLNEAFKYLKMYEFKLKMYMLLNTSKCLKHNLI
jgi:hypothetical protein